jgi:hypothetical protein
LSREPRKPSLSQRQPLQTYKGRKRRESILDGQPMTAPGRKELSGLRDLE